MPPQAACKEWPGLITPAIFFMDQISVQDAAQTLVIERFEQSPEIWQDGYNFQVEYDQISIFHEDEQKLVLVFYEDRMTLRMLTATSRKSDAARFEYADPTFDDQVLAEVKKRLHI